VLAVEVHNLCRFIAEVRARQAAYLDDLMVRAGPHVCNIAQQADGDPAPVLSRAHALHDEAHAFAEATASGLAQVVGRDATAKALEHVQDATEEADVTWGSEVFKLCAHRALA
jgi:hypothetical protein